jgi:NAD(P)-dependent dehydrogenase (short-subunit alcohol dehydrogenase family)
VDGEGRVALVTGAARGIGRRVALTLAEHGYRIAANDLDAPEETLEKLKQAGAETLSIPATSRRRGPSAGWSRR